MPITAGKNLVNITNVRKALDRKCGIYELYQFCLHSLDDNEEKLIFKVPVGGALPKIIRDLYWLKKQEVYFHCWMKEVRGKDGKFLAITKIEMPEMPQSEIRAMQKCIAVN